MSPAPPSDLHAFLRSRRTIHAFRPEPVPEPVLLRALETAVTAPNHRLTQPWRFILIGPDTARRIAHLNARLVESARGSAAARQKLDRWLGMPGWLCVACLRSDDPLRQQEDYAACACAVQTLQLALWSEGVGTKWGTGAVTRHPDFFDLLGIDPEAEFTVGLFWYGVPADVPPMPPRRPVDEVVRRVP